MERRTFLGALAGGLLAAPLGLEAQPQKTSVGVGELLLRPPPGPQEKRPSLTAAALKDLGWVEGQNLTMDRRWAESREQARVAITDMVRLNPDVIVTWSNASAILVRAETKTISIVVIGAGADLASAGLVASMAPPGGNLTGMQILSEDLFSKRLDFLKTLVPNLSRVAFLKDTVIGTPDPEGHARYVGQAARAAEALRLQFHPVVVSRSEEFSAAFRDMTRNGDKGLMVAASPLMFSYRTLQAELAASHRIPAVHECREYLEAGGLVSYGVNVPELRRRGAV
jgi:putative ABC transport system substrate-binding protein